MNRQDILNAAAKCVNGDRENDYGSPEHNFYAIASLWSDYLFARQPGEGTIRLEEKDVAAMLSLLKIARIASGKKKDDNWIDLAGYAACGGELQIKD